MTARFVNAACRLVANRCVCARICAFCTAIAAGTAKNSPSRSARSSNASLAWAYTFIAPSTSSPARSGNDNTLCTPRRPTRGPNRGHRRSPPSDPDRIVVPVAAAVMHGPSPRPYWMSSTTRTNGSLFTMVSARSTSISVNPAPSAPESPAPHKWRPGSTGPPGPTGTRTTGTTRPDSGSDRRPARPSGPRPQGHRRFPTCRTAPRPTRRAPKDPSHHRHPGPNRRNNSRYRRGVNHPSHRRPMQPGRDGQHRSTWRTRQAHPALDPVVATRIGGPTRRTRTQRRGTDHTSGLGNEIDPAVLVGVQFAESYVMIWIHGVSVLHDDSEAGAFLEAALSDLRNVGSRPEGAVQGLRVVIVISVIRWIG